MQGEHLFQGTIALLLRLPPCGEPRALLGPSVDATVIRTRNLGIKYTLPTVSVEVFSGIPTFL